MDLSGNEAKYFSLKEIYPFNPYSLPVSITVSRIHRAVLEDNLEAVKHLVDVGESVNIKEEHCEFTPLHLAVIRNSEKILDYLLSRDDIDVDARCSSGDTPLRTASGLGAYESVKKLIHAGANVNLPDKNNSSPLHASVYHPDICHLLIQNGAHIDAVDSSGRTPLHCTVRSKSLEAMYMLLYYNADANVPDEEGMTPFMHAIVRDVIEARGVLLDYVADFNEINSSSSFTVLGLALQHSSPFIKEIIERGADVNYGDHFGMNDDECAFVTCLSNLKDESVFKAVWERLCCYQNREPINLSRLFSLDPSVFVIVVQIIIESDNLELAVDSFTRHINFFDFIAYFVDYKLEVNQLIVLTYRLLEYGYRPTLEDDIYYLFFELELCELHRILFYMEINYIEYDRNKYSYVDLLFDLDCDVDGVSNYVYWRECQLSDEQLKWFLEHFRNSNIMFVFRIHVSDNKIMREVLDGLSEMPSLVELARNQARQHIRDRFKVTNICQFYTIIDYLPLPSSIKSILTYRKKIYDIKW